MKKICLAVLGVLAVGTFNAAHAQKWSSCAQYASTQQGSYLLQTNEWGTGSGQCIYANSATSWTATDNYSGSGIKGYPDTQVTLNQSIGSLKTLTSSFNASVPGGNANWNSAYDLFSTGQTDEVMVWENWNLDGPLADSYNCNVLGGVTGCPYDTNVVIDGVQYYAFHAKTNHNVISLLRVNKTNSGTVNLLNILKWAANTSQYKIGNQNWGTIAYGFEVTYTQGSQNFSLNSFSVTHN